MNETLKAFAQSISDEKGIVEIIRIRNQTGISSYKIDERPSDLMESMMTNPIYIFDLDGTLADISHRLHFIDKKKKDWTGFYRACSEDEPILEIRDLANTIGESNITRIWIVSGRSSEVRKETWHWLCDNSVLFDRLFMRYEKDHRPDFEIKEEWLRGLHQEVRDNIACVFEDRQSVVDMWRKNGIKCCQVAQGDF